MTKITSTLAGLAFVAAASIAPAFAQGANPGTFTYTGGPAPFVFSATSAGIVSASIPVLFNPTGAGATSTGLLVLSGGTLAFGTPPTGTFTGVTEMFTPISGPLAAFSDTGTVFVSQRTAGPPATFDLASDTTTFTTSGTSFNLVPGITAPVPEASTTASFGLLLALGLGGLAVAAKRKKVA